MGLIEININNSFNKKDNSTKTEDSVSIDNPNLTLNKNNNLGQTFSSTNAGSVTNNHQNNLIFPKIKNKTFFREIIIATVSSVISVIITYLIFGIK